MSTGVPGSWGPGCHGWDPAFAHLTEHVDRAKDFIENEVTRSKDFLAAQATANDQAIQADVARLAVQSAQGFGADIAAMQAAASAVSDKVSYGVESALRSACHTDEELAEGLCDVKDKQAASFYQLSNQVSNGFATEAVAITSGFKDNLRDNAVNTSSILVNAVTGFKDAVIDSSKNAAAAALAACQNTAAIQASIAQSATAAALAACQNTAAILAAQAECCCELKELIKGESGRTRELLDSNEKARLTAALTDAKLEIALSKQCHERRPG